MGVEELRRRAVVRGRLVGDERAAARREPDRKLRLVAALGGVVLADVQDAERRKALHDHAARDLHRRNGLDADALGPATKQALYAGDAVIGAQVTLEALPRDPAALAEIAQRFEDEIANDAARARVALIRRQAEHFWLDARLVPRAASLPRNVEEPRELVHHEGSGRSARADRRRVPQADRARERDGERHLRGLTTEARGELRHERLRSTDAGTNLVPGFADRQGERHRKSAWIV